MPLGKAPSDHLPTSLLPSRCLFSAPGAACTPAAIRSFLEKKRRKPASCTDARTHGRTDARVCLCRCRECQHRRAPNTAAGPEYVDVPAPPGPLGASTPDDPPGVLTLPNMCELPLRWVLEDSYTYVSSPDNAPCERGFSEFYGSIIIHALFCDAFSAQGDSFVAVFLYTVPRRLRVLG